MVGFEDVYHVPDYDKVCEEEGKSSEVELNKSSMVNVNGVVNCEEDEKIHGIESNGVIDNTIDLKRLVEISNERGKEEEKSSEDSSKVCGNEDNGLEENFSCVSSSLVEVTTIVEKTNTSVESVKEDQLWRHEKHKASLVGNGKKYVGKQDGNKEDGKFVHKSKAPSVVFIEEFVSVGRLRGAGLRCGNNEREQTLNELLTELVDFSGNSGVVLTDINGPNNVFGSSLLKPGKFGMHLSIDKIDIARIEFSLKELFLGLLEVLVGSLQFVLKEEFRNRRLLDYVSWTKKDGIESCAELVFRGNEYVYIQWHDYSRQVIYKQIEIQIRIRDAKKMDYRSLHRSARKYDVGVWVNETSATSGVFLQCDDEMVVFGLNQWGNSIIEDTPFEFLRACIPQELPRLVNSGDERMVYDFNEWSIIEDVTWEVLADQKQALRCCVRSLGQGSL
ncbi:hypothetical protein Tco_0716804 [Tanacetum coccineum]